MTKAQTLTSDDVQGEIPLEGTGSLIPFESDFLRKSVRH